MLRTPTDLRPRVLTTRPAGLDLDCCAGNADEFCKGASAADIFAFGAGYGVAVAGGGRFGPCDGGVETNGANFLREVEPEGDAFGDGDAVGDGVKIGEAGDAVGRLDMGEVSRWS